MIKSKFNYVLELTLITSVFFTFITYTININNLYLLKLLTISEVFGIIAIGLFTIKNFKSILNFNKPDPIYKSSFYLIFSITIGLFISTNSKATLLGIFTLIYLALLSFVIFITFKNKHLILIKTIIITVIAMSVLGFYDLIAIKLQYPTIFPNAEPALITSGFRFYGQTGDYTFAMLTFLIPYQFSNLSNNLSKIWQILLRVSTFFCFIVMIGTGRVSSIISLFIGIIIWLIYTKNFKTFKNFKLEFISLILFIISTFIFFPYSIKEIISRFKLRLFERQENNLASNFFMDNLNFSIETFLNNPIFGSGIASVTNPINNHEIHGTYFKILAETGIVGFVFYILFIIAIFKLILKNIKNSNENISSFFINYLPFFIASIIMNGYLYHLRKKEFWILLALIIIISKIDKKNIILPNEQKVS